MSCQVKKKRSSRAESIDEERKTSNRSSVVENQYITYEDIRIQSPPLKGVYRGGCYTSQKPKKNAKR